MATKAGRRHEDVNAIADGYLRDMAFAQASQRKVGASA
jgi:hypothetical protein